MEETKKWVIKQWGGETWLIQLKCCWDNKISTLERAKLDPYLTPHTRKNSRWIKNLKEKKN